ASVAWCAPLALVAMVVLWRIGRWYQDERTALAQRTPRTLIMAAERTTALSARRVGWALAVLGALIFSKYVYLASLNSYYTFYLITKFHLSIRAAQIDLFVFLGAVAAGTMLGGLIGDRIGVKNVIWISILGVFPFTALLPYASLFWTPILTVCIGL